jgi:hypothetical protein
MAFIDRARRDARPVQYRFAIHDRAAGRLPWKGDSKPGEARPMFKATFSAPASFTSTLGLRCRFGGKPDNSAGGTI